MQSRRYGQPNGSVNGYSRSTVVNPMNSEKSVETSLETLVKLAKSGNPEALESLVMRIQDQVYGLALRMLTYPPDAQDATQEILVKVISHLGTFRGESGFSSWVYRVAFNHLLNSRKRTLERLRPTLEFWDTRVDYGVAATESYSPPAAEENLFSKEIMIRCLLVVLLCLSRQLRAAYILSAVFELDSTEAARILGISPTAYRVRVSRARSLVREHMTGKCGLVQPRNACRCSKQISYAVETGWLDPSRLWFTRQSEKVSEPDACIRQSADTEIDDFIDNLFQNLPAYADDPELFLSRLRRAITSGRINISDWGYSQDMFKDG